jgi:hypothetical protein
VRLTKRGLLFNILETQGLSFDSLFSLPDLQPSGHFKRSYFTKPRTNNMKNSFMYDGAHLALEFYSKGN